MFFNVLFFVDIFILHYIIIVAFLFIYDNYGGKNMIVDLLLNSPSSSSTP